MAIFALRRAASFRNQSALLHKAAIHAGLGCEERDLTQRVLYPKEHWDRTVFLAPLWPRYIFDAVRISSPWVSRDFTLYGPVDGPYLLNVNFLAVIKQMKVVTVSQFCKECMEKSDVRVDGVVHHGIDPADFVFDDSPRYARLDKLRKKHPGRTIFFTNLNPIHRKGFPHLARALEILSKKRPKDFVFILHTGRAEALKREPKLVKIPNLVIEDAYNVLPFRQIALKTRSCDVFVFPSLLEGFGLPLLEAATAKRPIVSLDAPAMNELISDKEGWLFPMKRLKQEKWVGPGCTALLHDYDPADLAEVMEYAMDHPKESREKAEKAYEKSKRYHYLKVYKQLVAG